MKTLFRWSLAVAVLLAVVAWMALADDFRTWQADRALEKELREIHERALAAPTPTLAPTQTPRRPAPTVDFRTYNDSEIYGDGFRFNTPTHKSWIIPTPKPTLSEMKRENLVTKQGSLSPATYVPTPTPTSDPEFITRLENLKNRTKWAAANPSPTPTPRTMPPTDTPTQTATPIPFEVSDGVSAIPLIENAWAYLKQGVDSEGIFLATHHQQSILLGIADYYALDFDRRCLTERGTYVAIDQAVDLDYPGNTFYFADSRYDRHSGASSFSKGSLSSIREGDWNWRAIEWTLYYPSGLTDIAGRTWYYLRVWAQVQVSTCELIPFTGWYDSGLAQYYRVMQILSNDPPHTYELAHPCPYSPIREEELGRRDSITLRTQRC